MHVDHLQHNQTMQYQLVTEGEATGEVRDTWAEAATDAVEKGVGKWIEKSRTSIYLTNNTLIQRIRRIAT